MKQHFPLAVLVAIMLAFGSYYTSAIASNQQKIAESNLAIKGITASRFTSEDGLEVWKEIAELQKQIAVLAAQFKAHTDEG